MAEPTPSNIFRASPEERQREQFVLQHGMEPAPEQIDRSQAVLEAERTLDGLVADIAAGRLDIRDPSLREAVETHIRELRRIIETTSTTTPDVDQSAPNEENPLLELLGDDDEEALKQMRDYEHLLPPLARRLDEIGGQMERMRTLGIPDVSSYEQLRKQLTVSKEKMSQLRLRIVEIADGVAGASQGVVDKCRELRDRMRPVFERVEDAYHKYLGAHDAWLKDHAGQIAYGRRKADFGPYRERTLETKFFDKRIAPLMDLAAAVESNAQLLIDKKRMTPEDAEEMLSEVDRIHERLQELDAKAVAPQESRARVALVQQLDKLRSLLMEQKLPELKLVEEDPFAFTLEDQPPIPPPAPRKIIETGPDTFESEEEKGLAVLSSARAIRREVIARYASVQHALSTDQRRTLRARIALLSSAVRHAERQAYRARFSHPVRPPAWMRQSGAPQVAARLAMERAAHGSEHLAQRVPLRFRVHQLSADEAPEATLASAPQPPAQLQQSRRGFFAALGGAFKLK